MHDEQNASIIAFIFYTATTQGEKNGMREADIGLSGKFGFTHQDIS